MLRQFEIVKINKIGELFQIKNLMTYSLESKTQEIYEDIFCFYGAMTAGGFLLNLRGKIFEEAGLEPDLLIGHKFTETVFWQSTPHIPELLQNAVEQAAEGSKSKLQLDFRVNAKKNITVELSLLPDKNLEESATEILFFALDVTERERELSFHKERNEHFLYAADSADIGLWFWDLVEEKIISTPKCNEFYEVAPDDILTFESFIKMMHPEDSQRVIAALRDSQINDREYNIEYRVIYSDGRIQSLAASGKTFYDEEKNPVTMTGAVRKITEKEFAAEELARIHDREREALDNAEQANRAKDYFIAFVSHELRSPLNSILGWAKILLTRKVDEPTRQNALETIERSAKTQAKLIEDLVDSARITSGKLRLDLLPINLYEVVNNTFQSHRPTAESRQVNLKFEYDCDTCEVYGDPTRLQQVFTNLLTNALKFTPNGGEILIKLVTDEDFTNVIFEDSGEGISPEFLPRIFQQFTQVDDNVSRDKSGLGLGLTIVKTLVEKQGGAVKAESEGIGKGAKFTITLPLLSTAAKESSKSIPISQNPVKVLRELKILVVEDDFDSREVLKLFLEQNGAQVESAESANEALDILLSGNKFNADLIVSDIAMPIEDGYSFIQKVRKLSDRKISRIPAIALSAFATSENKEKAFSAGFQKYHTKPFEPDLLIEQLSQLAQKE